VAGMLMSCSSVTHTVGNLECLSVAYIDRSVMMNHLPEEGWPNVLILSYNYCDIESPR